MIPIHNKETESDAADPIVWSLTKNWQTQHDADKIYSIHISNLSKLYILLLIYFHHNLIESITESWWKFPILSALLNALHINVFSQPTDKRGQTDNN